MEKILAQAQELLASLQEAKSVAVKHTLELEKKIIDNNKLKTELDKREADLDKREDAVKSKEAPAKLLEDAKKVQAETNAALKGMDDAQKAFAKEVGAFNASKARELAEIAAAKEVIKKELETLKADRVQLEDSKKKYKDEILNKLKAVK